MVMGGMSVRGFTLTWRIDRWLLRAALGISVLSCTDATPPASGPPAMLEVASGDDQVGPVGQELPEALEVRVLDAASHPVGDQLINFRVISGGGAVFAGAAISNADGIVKERWTLGPFIADSQVVEARAVDPVSGTGIVFARFRATAVAGPVAQVVAIAGDDQVGVAGSTLSDSLGIVARDSFGNPISGASVSWTTGAAGNLAAGGQSMTRSDGTATAAWTLGPAAGTQSATATVAAIFASFIATASPVPTTLEKVAGDGQIAAPATPVPNAPQVRVRDASGQPKGGILIRFVVTRGGGAVSGQDAISDANGIATAESWTLGPAVGVNELAATSPSGTVVTFTATASHQPTALSLQIVEGDGQTALPGNAVGVAPAVKVRNAAGAAVSGVSVTFAVASGGGSVTGAVATSGADGIARVGQWTLGGVSGVNTLSASAANASTVTFLGTARQASNAITVSLTSPSASIVGDTVGVAVSTTSAYQLVGVTVQMAGRALSLTTSQAGSWSGMLSLVGAPRDTATMIVRATDVQGNVTEVVRSLVHDRKPRIVVYSPALFEVAGSSIPINAVCDDDDPNGCTISVRQASALKAGPAPSPLVTSLSTSGIDGSQSSLDFEARDSRNQIATITRGYFVVTAPRLERIGSVSGKALDASGSRILGNYTVGADSMLLLRNVMTGVADTVRHAGEITTKSARITPNGMVAESFRYGVGPNAILYVLRGSAVTTVVLNNNTSLSTAGDYAIYTVPPLGWGPLHRMTLSTGETTLIANASGNTDNSVAANGDVAYWGPDYQLFRYRGGVTTQITTDTSFWSIYPRTDGINIVFKRKPSRGDGMETVLFDGATSSLSQLATHPDDVEPDAYYAVSGGWVAFTKPDAASIEQVWTRSPTGTLRAVSALGTRSKIRALSPDGSVVFDAGGDRYLATAMGAPTKVSSTLGTVYWRGDSFIVVTGNTAFRILP